MEYKLNRIIESKHQPKSTNVTWIDLSGETPVEKHFINGRWVAVSSGGGGSIDISGKVDKVSGATENNFASFDANGGLQDSGCNENSFATAAQGTKADNAIPMPTTGTDGQILEKDSNEPAGVKWVPKPSDGKSALQIYNETYGTNLNEAQFIDVLKQNYPMEYVAYNQTAAEQPIGTGFSAIDTLTADSTTVGKMYLMPNNGTTPTGTILFVTVQTGVSTYAWYKLGNLNVPSNVLTEDDIADNLSSTDATKALSAKQGRVLSEILGLNIYIDFANQGIISYQNSTFSDGDIINSTAYKYSNPIFIKNGWTVKVFSRGAAFGAINTCNQDGTNIQVVVGAPNVSPTPTDYITYTYTATADCYVIVCGQFYFDTHPAIGYYLGDTDFLKDNDIDDELNVSKTDKLVSNAKIASMNNELQEINEALRKTDIDFSNQGIISNDGIIRDNTSYKYSNPIFIKSGWTVKVLSRGASFMAICKCDSSGTYIAPPIIAVPVTPIPTERVLYTWTNDGEDCYVRVCGQFYWEGEYAEAWYIGDIIHNDGGNTDGVLKEQTLTAELTMAYSDGNGGIIQYGTNANVEANSRKSVATIYWVEIGNYSQDETIQCTPFAPINEGETYKVYFYNANYSVISNITLTSNEEYSTTIPTGTKFIKLFVSSNSDLNYSVRYVEVKVKTDLLRWHGVRNVSTVNDYIKPVGSDTYYGTTLDCYRTIFEVPYKGQRLWNVGWFFYSPYYKPVGEKTKLVILYQGSDGYKFNQDWNAFSDNYHSIVFSLVHSGYNVALCSCLTSLYGTTSSTGSVSDCSGDQLSINAYQRYYEYLVKNFNVEEEPYLLGYSNGGMPCGRVNVLGDVKAKAIAGGAIITDLIGLLRVLGASVNINKILHNCGVPDDVEVEHAGPQFTTDDFEVLKSQGDILKNYSPMFMSCDGLDWNTYIDTMKGVSFTNIETNQAMIQLMSNVKIQSEIPIKIWITRDDLNVSYGIEKFYIEAVNRGGGRAFLRTMPNDAGRHAMGNYGNADSIKMQNYHFKDGTVADTTVFMNEVIDWFEQWR